MSSTHSRDGAKDPTREMKATHHLLLSADDFAMTDGVSRGIGELARAGRISATSVMVSMRHWPALGQEARALRAHIAVGLHFNLTLGAPLGPMPKLAPEGRFPTIADLSRKALRRDIDASEITAEMTRQIDSFVAAVGFPPDHIDGHQHVHALPVIRDGVLAALTAHRWSIPPLIRDPADHLGAILSRRMALAKSGALWWLSRGFGAAARSHGFPTNDSFAGVTGFDPASTASDFERAGRHSGALHLVMCHPGFPDDELRSLDPITDRRQVEYDHLMAATPNADCLWRPARTADAPPIDWRDIRKTAP
jgi:predicted glycoside hydrolase/deacetylase ChbG (UPF0249 family)